MVNINTNEAERTSLTQNWNIDDALLCLQSHVHSVIPATTLKYRMGLEEFGCDLENNIYDVSEFVN